MNDKGYEPIIRELAAAQAELIAAVAFRDRYIAEAARPRLKHVRHALETMQRGCTKVRFDSIADATRSTSAHKLPGSLVVRLLVAERRLALLDTHPDFDCRVFRSDQEPCTCAKKEAL